MNYADIKVMDIADGPGIRVSLFVSGCDHHCKGCFNSEAWDYNYGKLFRADDEAKILNLLEPDYIDGLTVLGGEPFAPKNVDKVYDFCSRVRNLYKDKKTIWIYSGYTFDQIWRNYCGLSGIKLLKTADVLVDGKFIQELHNDALRFRGSSNQRVIDLKKTMNNIGLSSLVDGLEKYIIEMEGYKNG